MQQLKSSDSRIWTSTGHCLKHPIH